MALPPPSPGPCTLLPCAVKSSSLLQNCSRNREGSSSGERGRRLLFPALGPLWDGERAHRQAPSSTRGIFSSLKTLFQRSVAGAQAQTPRGQFSQNHLDSGKNKQFSELLMASKVCPRLPGSAALGVGSWVRFQPFCNKPSPCPGRARRFVPSSFSHRQVMLHVPKHSKTLKATDAVACGQAVPGNGDADHASDHPPRMWVHGHVCTCVGDTQSPGGNGASGSVVAAGVSAQKRPRPAQGTGSRRLGQVESVQSFAPP